MEYGILPECVDKTVIHLFTVNIADDELSRMYSLLALSNIASDCYENSLPNGAPTLGLRREWLVAAKQVWERESSIGAILPVVSSLVMN